jgi:hypothetical protein
MASVARHLSRPRIRPATCAYRELLEKFLDDPMVTVDDREGLFRLAAELGLTRAEAEGVHLAYLRVHAWRDDVEHLAALLGLDRRTFEALLGDRVSPERKRADSAEMTPPPVF